MVFRRVLPYLLLVCAAACAEQNENQTAQPEILAVINHEPLLEEDFEKFRAVDPRFSEEDSAGWERKTQFREFLTQRLLLQEARKMGITAGEEEILVQVEEWLSEAQEPTVLLLEQAARFLMIQKLVREKINLQTSVSLRDMENYYESHSDEFVVEDQVHVLEILVDDSEDAQQIRPRVTFGDVRTFKEIAREHSKGLAAESGGDLGIFRKGQLPEDFEKVVFALKPGEISAPFRSAQGYHIFMVEEWIPRHAQKFYEVQGLIFQRLVAQKEREAFDLYVKQLFERASIEILDSTLAFDWRDPNGDLR